MITLPFVPITGAITVAVVVAAGHGTAIAALALACAAVLAIHQVARSRSLESLAYPVAGLALGLVFTTGLATNLIRSSPDHAPSLVSPAPAPVIPLAIDRLQATRPERPRRRSIYALTAICAAQAAFSLTLVWSNTAYVDEANYLWVGRLEIAHWLHGTSWPSTDAYRLFSGSPIIYPPLGALASSVGGIAAARILSLVFMLAATVFLYLAASRLIGRTGALFAAALWALSEPAMRLAFATFDPLSVFLTAFSAWLMVQACCRRHRGEFVAASAFILALANVTSYWGLVIDPVAIAFAFLAWRTRMPLNQSTSCIAWLVGAWALSFGVLMTASHSWLGLSSTVFGPNLAGYQGISVTLNQIWSYSALIIGLALIGAAVTLRSGHRNHAALLGALSFAAFIVTQLYNQTSWSIDKHLAYGIWFIAVSAGYACSKFIRWKPGARRSLAALCCVAAFVYPAAISWQSAWQRYHAWPDASSFIKAFKPIVDESHGRLFLPGHEVNIAEYYTPQGSDWTRWSSALSLEPGTKNSLNHYYKTQLHNKNYEVIALFYSTTFSSAGLPGGILITPGHETASYQLLLSAIGDNSREPGLPALTQVLETDKQYQLAAVGRYNTSNISGTHDYGIYAIWRKEPT